MEISYRWLKDYVNFTWSPEELAEKLTMSGTEIEGLTSWSGGLEGVVVGEILSRDIHPTVEQWVVCRVQVGERIAQVVSGAPNIAPGQKVPVALAGTVLPKGERIEATRLGGVESQGMICSEMELGLSRKAEGIMLLDESFSPGQSLAEVLSMDDWILRAEITPNRPDCMSMVGIAREVAALAEVDLVSPRVEVMEEGDDIGRLASVEIEDPRGCPRYTARVIEGVSVDLSPWWLRRRLMAVGIRPINTIVDVTNYVMFELGHPLHAFDYHLLRGHRIVVRRGKMGERLITLGGDELVVDGETLLICDEDGPVALAGIMGGEGSEVREETEAVLLESAYFDPLTIRRGAQRLKLFTESSQRFERGADPNGLVRALNRAAQMILELAGGKVAKGVIDVNPKPIRPQKVMLRPNRANEILGTDLSPEEMAELLGRLGFSVDSERLEVTVPTFRPDVSREIDIIEEIARLYGYDRIEISLRGASFAPDFSEESRLATEVSGTLSGLGLQEVVTSTVIDPRTLPKIGYDSDAQAMMNPLSQELSVLRPTLVPSLLQVVQRNVHQKVEDIRIFELGKVFLPRVEGPPRESMRLAGALMGSRTPLHWSFTPERVDFFDLKGVVETLVEPLFTEVEFLPQPAPPFVPEESATILIGERELGRMGRISPEVAEAFDLLPGVFLFDLDFTLLCGEISRERRYRPLPRYPAAKRDLALVVAEDIPSATVERVIWRAGSPLVTEVKLFDLYRGDQIEKGKRGLAYSISYQSSERTLTDEEVEEAQSKIVHLLCQELGVTLRE